MLVDCDIHIGYERLTDLLPYLDGPTRELVATLAWVLAASFVVNGLTLLEVASCTDAVE